MEPAVLEAPEQFEESDFEKIILDQMPQVKYIARRIHEHLPKHVPCEDLVQAGMVGLIDAVHKFDPGKNVKFASYAKFRIRGAILDNLRELDWSPRELRRKSRAIDSVTQKLQMELGRSASESELAKELGLSLAEFQNLTNEIRGLEITSLQGDANEEGQEEDLAQKLPSPDTLNPLTLCENEETRARLEKAMGTLPDQERKVLRLYYEQELTMKEVGTHLGVGESRVSQIHSLAVRHLRATL